MSPHTWIWILAFALVVVTIVAIAAAVMVRRSKKQVEHYQYRYELVRHQLKEIYKVPEVTSVLPNPELIGLVLNPTRPEADRIKRLVHQGAKIFGDSRVEVYETTPDDPGYGAAQRALEAGAQLILAAGGDGTVRSVAEALAGTEAELGIVPVGTGNLLARNLDLPYNDLDRCVGIALQGRQKRMDTVDIRFERDDDTILTSTFVVIAGAGIDAEIMTDTRDDIKQSVGWLAYGEAGVRKLPGKRQHVIVSVDDGPAEHFKVRSVMVANCGLLTGGIDMVPDAKIDDGLLDVVLLSPKNLWDWTRVAVTTLTKREQPLPIIRSQQGKKCRIEFPEPMVSQFDGDGTGIARVIQAEVRPHSLRVRVAATSQLRESVKH